MKTDESVGSREKICGYSPTYGKVEDIYYLKQRGKRYLIREHDLLEEEVNLPIGEQNFQF
ncbi:MAG: hypothetical protein R2784_14890 [Saprospiraceae bacterium]